MCTCGGGNSVSGIIIIIILNLLLPISDSMAIFC
jgi:hypothetical protein